jgi:23S rRNA (uridine2552-2'-O)-methyltransferase
MEVFPLKRGGSLYFKILQGGTEIELHRELRECFKTVKFLKPDASRKESRELFLLCLGYRGHQ